MGRDKNEAERIIPYAFISEIRGQTAFVFPPRSSGASAVSPELSGFGPEHLRKAQTSMDCGTDRTGTVAGYIC